VRAEVNVDVRLSEAREILGLSQEALYFIAEIGINHNGSLENAKKLIDLAKRAGCDAVKFQKRTLDIVYSKAILDSPRDSPWGTTTREQKEGLEFDRSDYLEIDEYCKKIGIKWFASAWDIPSQFFLRDFDLPFNKVASALATHGDFLKEVASEKKLTFLSTGMMTMDQVESAVNIFRDAKCPFILMHTTSVYPAPEGLLNLRALGTLRDKFEAPVGYSGHESTVMPSLVAAVLGAVAIERHITLDRAMYGSDQAASLAEKGLVLLVDELRRLPSVLGDGVKKIEEGESEVAAKLRYWENGH
jgi:N-acetylneuraminate synthase